MMIVAAIEHAARELVGTVGRALAEKCSGFSDYEAGDHLGAWKSEWFHDRVTREYYRKQLVDQEAEEEVSDPQHYARNLFVGIPYAPAAGQRGESNPAASEPPDLAAGLSTWRPSHPVQTVFRQPGFMYGTPIPASLCATEGKPCELICGECRVDPSPTIATTASQPRVGGEGSPADSDILRSPAGERLTWPAWAVPAICEVLADHVPSVDDDQVIYCNGSDTFIHRSFADWQDWRDHVSDLIAERLDTAWRAKQSRQHIETGHDMGASMASEFFPQHRRPTK